MVLAGVAVLTAAALPFPLIQIGAVRITLESILWVPLIEEGSKALCLYGAFSSAALSVRFSLLFDSRHFHDGTEILHAAISTEPRSIG